MAPLTGESILEQGDDFIISLTREGKARYQLMVDGIVYVSGDYPKLELVEKELDIAREQIPKKLDHLLRAAGFQIYYEAEVYYWCAKYNGKVYKSFMKDYDLGLKSILKQWKKDRQNGTSNC